MDSFLPIDCNGTVLPRDLVQNRGRKGLAMQHCCPSSPVHVTVANARAKARIQRDLFLAMADRVQLWDGMHVERRWPSWTWLPKLQQYEFVHHVSVWTTEMDVRTISVTHRLPPKAICFVAAYIVRPRGMSGYIAAQLLAGGLLAQRVVSDADRAALVAAVGIDVDGRDRVPVASCDEYARYAALHAAMALALDRFRRQVKCLRGTPANE